MYWPATAVPPLGRGRHRLHRHLPHRRKTLCAKRHEDKVPAMGWNSIYNCQSALFKGIAPDEFVYFVHSYYVPLCDFTAATANYIAPFSAALHKDNFYATQFHPEKSGVTGEKIIKNFLEL